MKTPTLNSNWLLGKLMMRLDQYKICIGRFYDEERVGEGPQRHDNGCVGPREWRRQDQHHDQHGRRDSPEPS